MRAAALLALALGTAAALQGCFPVVATGVGVAALSAADRRTTGAQVEDQAIELKIENRASQNFGTAQYHLNAISYNRRVLLTGEAANEKIKNDLTDIARSVPGVVAVTNEMAIGPNTSFSSRSNDALVTSNVKARFVTNAAGRFTANHVKVFTEKGVVYLLGIVTPAEGEAAAEIASGTSGVQRVVKVFEYADKVPQ